MDKFQLIWQRLLLKNSKENEDAMSEQKNTDLTLEGLDTAMIEMQKRRTDEPVWEINNKPLAALMRKSHEIRAEWSFEKLMNTTEGRNWLAYKERCLRLQIRKKYIKKWAKVRKAKKLGEARRKSDA